MIFKVMLMVAKKRKKPTFKQMNYGKPDRKRVKASWRKPRGIDNKQRMKLKHAGKQPSIGWGTPRSARGNHPCGLPEVIVFNISQLKSTDAKKNVVRVSSKVGSRTRAAMRGEAAKLGIKLVN